MNLTPEHGQLVDADGRAFPSEPRSPVVPPGGGRAGGLLDEAVRDAVDAVRRLNRVAAIEGDETFCARSARAIRLLTGREE